MDDKDFIIYEGKEGTFNKLGDYQTLPADVDNMFANFRKDKVKKITFFFHGGLVNEHSGRATAYIMEQAIAGAQNTPICFVWKTGLAETIASNLGNIAGTTLFQKLLKILLKAVAKKLGFNDVFARGAAPQTLTDNEINTELLRDAPFEDYVRINIEQDARGAEILSELTEDNYALEQAFYPDIDNMIRTDADLVAEVSNTAFISPQGPATGSRGIISMGLFVKCVVAIGVRVVKRFIEKRDHDFYPTIIEEILRQFYIAELGAEVWNEMKTKAAQMWEDNSGRTGLDQHAGRYLLDRLADYLHDEPGLEINLVGHSAGAIVICNMLKNAAAAYPQMQFGNIIFMAPACRTDIFNAEIVQYPGRYRLFRSFTMADVNEKKDILVKGLYTHSLLYLISGILEDSGKGYDEYIFGMERHICGKRPYDAEPTLVNVHAYTYLPGSDRLVLSETNPDVPGVSTHALHHGGFPEDPATKQSMIDIIKQ